MEIMENFLTQAAGSTLEFLGKQLIPDIESIWKNEEAIKALANTVEHIRRVLSDVHGKQFQEESVEYGYQQLRQAFLDAEDFLDKVETLKKKRDADDAQLNEQLNEEKEGIKKMDGRVQRFLAYCQSKTKLISNKVKHGSSIAVNAMKDNEEVEKIKKELEAISKGLQGFRIGGATATIESDVTHNARGTGSHVDTTQIIGRDQDQSEIVKLLKTSFDQAIGVVSIVGMGGMGKTTLAQLVFNDIGCNFDLKLWASDCKKFKLEWLLKKLISSIDSSVNLTDKDLDGLKDLFIKGICGKKVFLVLDDVEYEETFIWDHLTVLLKAGNTEESRILVTTRSKKVTSGIGANNSIHQSIHQLKGLSEDDSLSLFENFSLSTKRDENLIDIAQDIVKRCGGVPLAIKVIGRHLRGKNRSTWEHVKDCGLKREEDYILPILKISYDGLDSTLKQCFSFCALFPKNCEISWQVLRNIWIIYVSFKEEEGKTLREICNDKLEILCQRFFLEKTSALGDEDFYLKMHDLMHDLTTKVAAGEMVVVDLKSADLNKVVLKDNVRHFTIVRDGMEYDVSSTFEHKREPEPLRTFLQATTNRFAAQKKILNVDKLVTAFPLLRVLDLKSSGIKKLTDSIGKLIHLRYLDISDNDFKTLPDSVTELINLRHLNLEYCGLLTCLPNRIDALTSLEELNLSCCYHLHQLPTDIVKLTNLKYLETKGSEVTEMPSGIGALTVSRFIVGPPESKHSAQLEELGLLSVQKEGKLEIEIPKSISLNGRGDGEAYLVNKKGLRDLHIKWVGNGVEGVPEPENHIAILAKLQPPLTLEKLFLSRYQGMTFPPWVPEGCFASVLPNLVELHLERCDKCLHLPPLSRLPFLRSLFLHDLSNLEYIEEENIATAASFCPCLEKLDLIDLPELKDWCRGLDNGDEQPVMLPSFPHLNSLKVVCCPKLRVSPLLFSFVKVFESSQTSSLRLFDEVRRDNGSFWLRLEQEIDKHSLKLNMSGFHPTESTSIYMDEAFRGMTDRLTHLTISFSELKTLPRGMQRLTTLQELYIAYCDDFIWEYDDNQSLEDQQTSSDGEMSRKPLESLQVLTLRDLSKMVKLPEWIQLVTSLRKLTLYGLPRMETLPEWIQLLPSFEMLKIERSPNFIVPEWVHNTFEDRSDDDTFHFVSCKRRRQAR